MLRYDLGDKQGVSDDEGDNEANLHCDILSGPGEPRMFTEKHEEESRWTFATQCTA